MAEKPKTTTPSGPVEETLINAAPAPATVTDAIGVERIVEPTVPDWSPAPVAPHPDDVKRAKELEKRFAEQRQNRLATYADGEVGASAKPAQQAVAAEQKAAATK